MKINDLLEKTNFPEPVISKYEDFNPLIKNGKVYINSPIYKGIFDNTVVDKAYKHLLKLNPPTNRRAAYTSNWYNILIDEIHPAWKNFPKRSQSFICSTSRYRAENYGAVLNYVPMVGIQIGLCPDEDIWGSWKYAASKSYTKYDFTARIFNEIEYLALQYDLLEFDYNYTDEQIRAAWKGLIRLSRGELEKKSSQIGDYILEQYNTFKDFILDAFDPEKNGFKLVTLDNSIKLPSNNELWFSSSCYVMPPQVFDEKR